MIGGKQREERNFEQPKYVGLVEVRVIGINPTAEEFEALLGWAPKEDSKQLEYLGESKDGNTYLRVDVWMEEVKKRKRDDETEVNEKFKVSFYLEDKERENRTIRGSNILITWEIVRGLPILMIFLIGLRKGLIVLPIVVKRSCINSFALG